MDAPKLLGPPTGYIDLLNHVTEEKLRKDQADGTAYQKTPIRPSAAGECARSLFYQLQEFHNIARYNTETISPETHRIFGLGHSVEYHAIKQFEMLKDVFDLRYKQQVLSFAYLPAEKNLKLSQWLEGSLDLVLWSDKWKCVIDFKSKKDKFSAGYKSNWDDTDDKLSNMKSVKVISDGSYWVESLEDFLHELRDPFFEANFKQLNMYACSEFLRERGVDHGAIIQYNKNDSRLREIRFKPSLEMYQSIVTKMGNVIKAVDTGDISLAPKEFVLGSIKCAFCKFKKECWPESDPKKEFFGSFKPKQWPKDTSRLGKLGENIEKLFINYEQATAMEPVKKQTEQEIIHELEAAAIDKVALQSGHVYEVKRLKDGLVLRRSKK